MGEGLPPDQFWRQTPRLLDAVFKGRMGWWQRQHEMATAQAHLTAQLGLVDPKKFPTLDKLLGRKAAKVPQTGDEMLLALHALQARGAPMTIRKVS